MNRSLWYRVLVVAAATLLAILYVLPTAVGSLPEWWGSVLPKQAIRLGLDLQGGMHLVLEVQTEKAIEFSVERTAEDLKRELQTAKVPFTSVTRVGSRSLAVQLAEGASAQEVTSLVKE